MDGCIRKNFDHPLWEDIIQPDAALPMARPDGLHEKKDLWLL